MSEQIYDLLVIGGGINGVGIARDAAGRGLSVLLCEQGDLGGATSSASSKLLHGGLRYLEQYRFRMVRRALAEREVLLRNAPHIVRPLRFVLPHDPDLRPAWQLRVGLFLYDHLARSDRLPKSRAVDLAIDPVGEPLKPRYKGGFVYSDCLVDDARLVILNAIDARELGVLILPRTGCAAAERHDDFWMATLLDMRTGAEREVRARVVVNAAGPWAAEVNHDVLGVESRFRLRLVKGSHIVVRRLYDGDQAYILQHRDRRVVFVIPVEREFSLIGTTDVPIDGEPRPVEIDSDETNYLLNVINCYFDRNLGPDEIVWSFAGLRPLIDDGTSRASEVTRDYKLDFDDAGAPVLTVWGGKLTSYRLLAEQVMKRLQERFSRIGPSWTAQYPLPGGRLVPAGFEDFLRMVTELWDWLPPELADAYARRYGSRIHMVMGNVGGMSQLGREISPGLYEREVRYLVKHEWAMTCEDVLWRRTKLGLFADARRLQDVDDLVAGLRRDIKR